MKLEALFHPGTVALIGASRTSGKVGHEVLANLLNGGFEGEVVPVNRAADQWRGRRCYRDLRDYEGTIDLSIVAVPAPEVAEAVDRSIEKGARAIIIITAGFKEAGPEGGALEADIAQKCRQHQVRLLGPNSLGLIDTRHRLNASFAPQMPSPGSVSVISQSGALCTAILDRLVSRGLGLAKLVHLGNKAEISECDLLVDLAGDADTAVVAVYLESIESGPEFLRAAEIAASQKPVVIMKSAVTEGGRSASSSHTGNLVDANLAHAAAFHRCGLLRADDFDALLDTTTVLAMQPLPAGDRIAIVTNAGGAGDTCSTSEKAPGASTSCPLH